MENYPLAVEDRGVPCAEGDKPDKSFIVDEFYHQPDLVHMGCQHHGEPSAFLHGYQVSHQVRPDLIDVSFHSLRIDRCDAPLAPRDTVGLRELLE